MVGAEQLVIMLSHGVGNLQLYLWQIASVVGQHVGIGFLHHMQHDVVIPCIAVVSVDVPVAAAQVYLDVAHPQRTADAHLRVEEVGPGVAVVQARVYHLHLASVGRRELVQWQQLVLPHIMQQQFHKYKIFAKIRIKT